MKTLYQCDNCKNVHDLKTWIFTCHSCEKEICDMCMHGWGVCKECAKGKSDAVLAQEFNERNS